MSLLENFPNYKFVLIGIGFVSAIIIFASFMSIIESVYRQP